jgi:hypothetical protein
MIEIRDVSCSVGICQMASCRYHRRFAPYGDARAVCGDKILLRRDHCGSKLSTSILQKN